VEGEDSDFINGIASKISHDEKKSSTYSQIISPSYNFIKAINSGESFIDPLTKASLHFEYSKITFLPVDTVNFDIPCRPFK
jgi:hypothetical protein